MQTMLYCTHLFETAAGGLGLAIHPTELALHNGAADGEALAGLQLGRQREQPFVLHIELVVQLGQHQDLRPPVLSVRRPVLQPVIQVIIGLKVCGRL